VPARIISIFGIMPNMRY